MNNMHNGLMFGMEGPNMEGTWYNPKTGDSFTVRNSFFQDNQYLVQTTDGRVLDYNTLQNYVQSDRPIEMPKPQPQQEILPAEVENLLESPTEMYDILPEDLNMINSSKSLGNLATSTGQVSNDPVVSIPYTQVDQNFAMIEKALAKKSLPEIQVAIDWQSFPRREMDMLIDIMDVNMDEIVNWYTNQIDIEYLSDCLKEVIKDHIYKQLSPETITAPQEVVFEAEPVEVKKEEKKETKQTPKSRSSKSKSKSKK